MLVERDALVAALVAALGDAVDGTGRLVFVSGEAGVGKSALVRAVADLAPVGVRVRVGAADNVTTADALAPFREALPEIEPVVVAGVERLRLLRAIRATIAAEPSLVVLEDLHWADEATLDALRYLARRLDGMPTLILATFRDDEVLPRHPLRLMLGDVGSDVGVTRTPVPRLTVAGVAQLVDRAGVDLDPVDIHRRTGGNAFFATELLDVSAGELPSTVSDTVLARVARLSSAAQDVACAAAVLGAPSSASVLVAVSGADAAGVDECLAAGLLVGVDRFGYRHELARQAVETSLSVLRRRQLHTRALRELARRTPEDHRTLAHHATGCGDEAATARHARLAGDHASSLGAHREAVAQFRLALSATTPPAQRARLFAALSYECYLTDQLHEAITARQRALDLHRLAGDEMAVGDDERWLSRTSWFAGRGADAERYARLAIETLEPLGPSESLAMAYSNMSQLRMLGGDDAAATSWGRRALELADRFGNRATEAHALNNVGTAAIVAGRTAEGRALLARSLDIALASDLQEHAARAHTNLGSSAIEHRDYTDGIALLDAGIAYCEERDLDSWARYMRAWRSVALADAGRLDDALTEATALLGHPGIAPVSAIPAATAAARATARRGDGAAPFLAHATELASQTGELQRIAPVACASAEDAWLKGEPAAIVALTDPAWNLALEREDASALGELAWWRLRAGDPALPGVRLLPPFAAMVEGDFAAAAVEWRRRGSLVWEAYATAALPDAAAGARAIRILDELGATRAASTVLRDRRDHGMTLPRRAHAATRAQPGGLTARERDVLDLLADGLATAEIARTLVISPRTAEHHISAVLHKLNEPTRARAVVAARRAGILIAPSSDSR